MSLSNSRMAYADCYALMDRALEEPRGIRVELESKEAATFMRMRVHQARQINRRENKETYPEDHPMHGCSAYDRLVCRLDEDGCLYIDKQVVNILSVESIPDDAPTMIEQTPVKLLEPPKEDFVITDPPKPAFKRRV